MGATLNQFVVQAALSEARRVIERDRVIHFIELGLKEGAELVAGGAERPALDKGYFVQPTVLVVQPDHTLVAWRGFGRLLLSWWPASSM